MLTAWNQQPLIDDASLLVGELITNAIRYSIGDIVIRMELAARLRIEIHDSSEQPPDLRPVDADSENGRGLTIVEQLATAWGHHTVAPAGKVVWFEL